jgi:DNA polymerase III subunit delta
VAAKTFDDLTREIKNKIYHPIYLLQGDEAYYIDKINELLENEVLGEMEKEFNQTIVYGKDCDPLDLVSILKRYPMMANYQVVVVREAQNLKGLSAKSSEDDEKDEEGKSASDGNALINYLNNPLNTTVLVLCYKYKTLDKRSKAYKAIDKKGVVFESKKLYDSAIQSWIEKYLAEKNFKIQPIAAKLMADHLGTDLSKIVNEVDKLLINTKPGTVIDTQLIETNIGISKDYNIFELQAALGKKEIVKATRIVNYFKANPKSNPFVLSLFNINSYFTKLLLYHSLQDKSKNNVVAALKVNPFFVGEYENAAKNYSPQKVMSIIGLMREYDLKSKGINNAGTPEGELLKELVFKIMH